MTDHAPPPGRGGIHCETSTLGLLMAHAGVTLSEPMLFGLGSGLSFIYWDSQRQDVPFLGGRVKPFVLTQNLASRLGIEVRAHETTSARTAWETVRNAIDAGTPVGLQLDSYDLEYFTSRVHFAGHMVALYGYDDEQAYVVDTAQQGGAVTTSLDSLARARAAKGPMAARHRSFTLAAPHPGEVPARVRRAIIPAITACATEFLAAPIANLGHRGIVTTSRRIQSWSTRIEDPGNDLPTIAMLMERAGTGGALFRNLYTDFLTECVGLVDDASATPTLTHGRDLFAKAASLWTDVAALIARAGTDEDPDLLTEASHLLEDIAALEHAAMTELRTL